jgi:hypothetical protein
MLRNVDTRPSGVAYVGDAAFEKLKSAAIKAVKEFPEEALNFFYLLRQIIPPESSQNQSPSLSESRGVDVSSPTSGVRWKVLFPHIFQQEEEGADLQRRFRMFQLRLLAKELGGKIEESADSAPDSKQSPGNELREALGWSSRKPPEED